MHDSSSLGSMILQTQTVMLMTMFTTLFSGIIGELIKLITQIVKKFYEDFIGKKFKDKTNCVIISRNKYIYTKNGSVSDPNYRAESYIEALTNLMDESKNYGDENITEIVDTKPTLSKFNHRDLYLANKIKIIPKGIINIDGFLFEYVNKNTNKNSKDEISDQLCEEKMVIIRSTKSVQEINDFVEKIHTNWVEKYFPIISKDEEILYEFCQMGNDEKIAIFKRYPIPRNYILFDELFFEEKEEFQRILNLFAENKLHRLGIMMSGEPGGGKTSLARAIAVKFNMHIISINIDLIKNDSQLKDIVQSNNIMYQEKGNTCWSTIPSHKRLYLLDDADCGSDILLDREIKARKLEKMDSLWDSKYGIKSSRIIKDDHPEDSNTISPKISRIRKDLDDKVTLQGVLNVMDGVTPMGGILILNTNRPKDIDSAIKRPGRIDIEICLGRMSSKNVKQLIKYCKYDSKKIAIPENVLMGCVVKNICIFAKNQADFEEKLKKEIIKQQEIIENKQKEIKIHNQTISKIKHGFQASLKEDY